MEEGAETAEELCVDHLARSLPLEVGVVQSVVLVQPEECNDDKKRKRRYLQLEGSTGEEGEKCSSTPPPVHSISLSHSPLLNVWLISRLSGPPSDSLGSGFIEVNQKTTSGWLGIQLETNQVPSLPSSGQTGASSVVEVYVLS